MACGILIPQPGLEPTPSAVKMQSPNLWTREFLQPQLLTIIYKEYYEQLSCLKKTLFPDPYRLLLKDHRIQYGTP